MKARSSKILKARKLKGIPIRKRPGRLPGLAVGVSIPAQLKFVTKVTKAAVVATKAMKKETEVKHVGGKQKITAKREKLERELPEKYEKKKHEKKLNEEIIKAKKEPEKEPTKELEKKFKKEKKEKLTKVMKVKTTKRIKHRIKRIKREMIEIGKVKKKLREPLKKKKEKEKERKKEETIALPKMPPAEAPTQPPATTTISIPQAPTTPPTPITPLETFEKEGVEHIEPSPRTEQHKPYRTYKITPAIVPKKRKAFIHTGVRGLDDILGGGIPEGASVLITGHPHCGKKPLIMQLAYTQLMKKKPVIFILTDFGVSNWKEMMARSEWGIENNEYAYFVDCYSTQFGACSVTNNIACLQVPFLLSALSIEVSNFINEIRSKTSEKPVIILHSLSTLINDFGEIETFKFIQFFSGRLRTEGITFLMTIQRGTADEQVSRSFEGLADYVIDMRDLRIRASGFGASGEWTDYKMDRKGIVISSLKKEKELHTLHSMLKKSTLKKSTKVKTKVATKIKTKIKTRMKAGVKRNK
jgi:KaiC/GvpD/RAD55 family RecA-like ATPase